jgi:hypothetical protein
MGWSELAIPKIASGIDGLDWVHVVKLLVDVFQNTGIAITVYTWTGPQVAAIKLNAEGASSTVPVIVHGSQAVAIIDTAAQVTVISEEFYKQLEDPPELGEALLIKSATVDGRMDTRCCHDLILELGERKFQIDVFVAPITDQILLGLDFMSEYRAVINLEDCSLGISGSSFPSNLPDLPIMLPDNTHLSMPM